MQTALLVAFGLIGLHLPKAFTVFYLALALMAWSTRRVSAETAGPLSWPIKRSALLLLLFGLAYGVLSLHFGLWRLGGTDLLDLVSVILLPALGLLLGARAAAAWSWGRMGWLWLAYGLGALAYVWIVLLHGRFDLHHPLALFGRRFENTITTPWGGGGTMNVRSIEQNAMPALSWLLLGAYLLLQRGQRALGLMLLGAGALGLAAVVAFHGRIGLLVAALGGLPVALAAWPASGPLRPRLNRLALAAAALAGTLWIGILLRLHPWLIRLGGRLYDERFDRFAGFLTAAPRFPWGGNLIQFDYPGSQAGSLDHFDASTGELLHNVLFDVYARVGLLPTLLLLAAVLPLLWIGGRHLVASVRHQRAAELTGALLAAGLLLTLTVQWLFQPLLYADGLLFYLGFLLLGFLAAADPEPAARAPR